MHRRHSRWVDMHYMRPQNELKPLVEQLMYRCDDVAALVGLGCPKRGDDMGLVEIAIGNLIQSEKQIQRKNSRVMEWLEQTPSVNMSTEIASGLDEEPSSSWLHDVVDWDAARAPTPTSDLGIECGDASDNEDDSSPGRRTSCRPDDRIVAPTADGHMAALSDISTKLGENNKAEEGGQLQDESDLAAQSQDPESKVRNLIKGFEVMMTGTQSAACTPRKLKTPRTPRVDPSTAIEHGASCCRTSESGNWSADQTPLRLALETEAGLPKRSDNPPLGAKHHSDLDKMPRGLEAGESRVQPVLQMLQREILKFENAGSEFSVRTDEPKIEGLQDLSMPSPVPELNGVTAISGLDDGWNSGGGCYDIPSPVAKISNSNLPALTLLTKRPSTESVGSCLSVNLSPHGYELSTPPPRPYNSPQTATDDAQNIQGQGEDPANVQNQSTDSSCAWTICVPQAERMAEDVKWHVRTSHREMGGLTEARYANTERVTATPSDRVRVVDPAAARPQIGEPAKLSPTTGLETVLRGMQDILKEGQQVRSDLVASNGEAARSYEAGASPLPAPGPARQLRNESAATAAGTPRTIQPWLSPRISPPIPPQFQHAIPAAGHPQGPTSMQYGASGKPPPHPQPVAPRRASNSVSQPTLNHQVSPRMPVGGQQPALHRPASPGWARSSQPPSFQMHASPAPSPPYPGYRVPGSPNLNPALHPTTVAPARPFRRNTLGGSHVVASPMQFNAAVSMRMPVQVQSQPSSWFGAGYL